MPTKKKQNAFTLIMPLLEDPENTEIMIDGTARITIEKRGKIEDTNIRFKSNDEVKAVIKESLQMAGVDMEEGRTVYEVRLSDNSRMIAILSPTAVDGHCVIFRKWMSSQVTWDKLIEYNAISPEARDVIQSAIDAHINILIAGGTNSGKTTFANRVVELISPKERVVAVEQAHEFQFTHPRAIYLEADDTTAKMNDLLTAGSKMRPDWLVVGDMNGAEAMRTMQIFANGHAGITTIHASNAENALTRLETMCLMANLGLGMDEIRQTIVSALRLIAYQERLPNGQRKMVQLVELKGLENGRYILQPLMRYDTEKDAFEMTSAKSSWEK